MPAATSRASATALSCRRAGTSMRVGALQDWPLLLKQSATPQRTAASRICSSSTTSGDLPPSSWCTRFTVSAPAFATAMPARVEPVNDTMSTSGCVDSAWPTPGPSPCTRLNTPLGTPASCMTSAKIVPDSGAISLGFSTMVQPAASAGATLQVIWFMGQFQGVMKAHTPTGSRTRRRPSRSSVNGKVSRTFRIVVRCPMPSRDWERRAKASGAPISSEIARAMSSWRRS